MRVDWKALQAANDPADMYGRVAGFPEQMQDAWRIGQEFAATVETGGFQRVVVCGMGGSAIGADMARSFFGSRLRMPLISCRDYEAPAYLRDDSLVLLSSYSGNTGETLSAFESLRGGTSRFIAVTSGGEIEAQCVELGIPVCRIPGGMPPRSAIGYSLMPMLSILRAVGAADFDDAEYNEALASVRKCALECAMASSENPAAAIASSLHGRLPFVYAGAGLFEAVARRWACQLEENGKTLAHFGIFSELNHNEIVGWEAMPELMKSIIVVSLEDEDDPPMTRRQTEAALKIISPLAADLVRVDCEGGRLARALTAMLLGDFVSVYLAFLYGVDPTPVEKIDHLKSQLQ